MTKHTESILGNIEIATLIPSSPQPVVPDLLEDKIAVKGLVGDGGLLVLSLDICGCLARKELVAEIDPAGP